MMGKLMVGLVLALAGEARAGQVEVPADRDATLFEDPAGLLASGVGGDLYVGRTGQTSASRRRALVHFDLSVLPRNAVIESVRLHLVVTQATPRPAAVAVHRVTADWGEGASVSLGGGGAPAQPGDATWSSRFHGGVPLPANPPEKVREHMALWAEPGGEFDAAALATADLSRVGQLVVESAEMANDVQRWVRAPQRNFGWILIGDESQGGTARRLGARENVLPATRARLTIVYRER